MAPDDTSPNGGVIMCAANAEPSPEIAVPPAVGQELAETDRTATNDWEMPQGEEMLFAVLLRGGTAMGAARASGMSETTVHRRLRDPRFRRRLEEARAVIRDSIVQRLTDAAGAAVERLWGLTEHEDISVQMQSCKILLDSLAKVQDVMLRHSDKVRETYQVEQRDDDKPRRVATRQVTRTVSG